MDDIKSWIKYLNYITCLIWFPNLSPTFFHSPIKVILLRRRIYKSSCKLELIFLKINKIRINFFLKLIKLELFFS